MNNLSQWEIVAMWSRNGVCRVDLENKEFACTSWPQEIYKSANEIGKW